MDDNDRAGPGAARPDVTATRLQDERDHYRSLLAQLAGNWDVARMLSWRAQVSAALADPAGPEPYPLTEPHPGGPETGG